MKKLKLQRCVAGDDRLINSMSTLRIAARAAGKGIPSYNHYMEVMTEACNVHDAADLSKKHAKPTPTRQVLMGEVNHYNDDFEDEFFYATDYTAFDIQNASPDTLRSFTTTLLEAHQSASKRDCRPKRTFNPEIDIPSAAFKNYRMKE